MRRACMPSSPAKTYEGRTLIAFGGGGPVHACRVAEKIGIARVLVPAGAGVGSAIGFLRAPVGYEVVRSLYQRFSSFDVAAVNALLDGHGGAKRRRWSAQGSFGAPTDADAASPIMRYVGQGHEIPVPLPARPLTRADVAGDPRRLRRRVYRASTIARCRAPTSKL